ncbi:hypothetical protein D3C74_251590 [compost metagenome]
MKVDWKLSIGFPHAFHTGTILINDRELEVLTEEQREEKIQSIVWEEVSEYVDIKITNTAQS